MRKLLWLPVLLAGLGVLGPERALAQQLTGTLIGTVKDQHGGVLPGATVTVSSPALFGGALTAVSNEWGQLRFSALPPGSYALEVVLQGFGRLIRAAGSAEVPRLGFVVAGHLQHFSGKPWAASTQIALPQGDQRVLLEPRGTRRLSAQTLLDLRVSRLLAFGGLTRVELLLDVLNALNDTAEEALATDNLFSPTFGRPTLFVDPRRVMAGVRVTLGR